MNNPLRILNEICEKIKEKGHITPEHKFKLCDVFGKRAKKALQTVFEGRVKRYVVSPTNTIFWVVVGRSQDYLVLPLSNFCSCDDFYFRVLSGEVPFCYHIMAQKLAEASGKYEEIHIDKKLYSIFIKEWKNPKAS